MDLCDLERFFKFERWQDGRQTLREHCLAGSRRSDKENVVATSARDLECAFCILLSTNLGEVEPRCERLLLHFGDIELQRLDASHISIADLLHKQRRLTKISHGVDIDSLHDRGFGRILFWEQKMFETDVTRRERDRERSAHRTHAAVERQLADTHDIAQVFQASKIAVRPEDA